jgi:formylglycine-generating enzyme required for sulfatase activity
MVWIPSGTFTMGSPDTELGRQSVESQHSVTLTRAFFMDRTEVSQGAWKALSGGVNPSCFQATAGTSCTTGNANDGGPVEQVDWYSALAFANARSVAEGLTACYTLTGCTDPTTGWRDGVHSGCTGATFVGLTCNGYRLPTESEWEYAARAGTTTATYGGNLSERFSCASVSGAGSFASGTPLGDLAWYRCNNMQRSQVVGGKAANAWGLRDMLGNVSEWTWDPYEDYPGTVIDPLGATTGFGRVYRGGAWNSDAQRARSAERSVWEPVVRSSVLGLRLARTANP